MGTAMIRIGWWRTPLVGVLLWLLALPGGEVWAADLSDHWTQIRVMFPQAERLGPLEGSPPSAAVYGADAVLGYVLLTNDVLRIPAYSGKPVNSLVGFDITGAIRGVRIVEHEEPILVIGIDDADLADYTAQYRGLAVTDDIRIGGHAAPGRPVIDGITGATITVMVINRAVAESVKRVAMARGLLQAGEGAVRFAPPEPLWQTLWHERQVAVVMLLVGLLALVLILLFQDWLARHPTLLKRIRTAYLWFTLLFIGAYGMAQLSIVNVLTFVNALLHGFQWESFLMDPLMFLLWSFVAFTVLLWGRGVYCGWLCPFGALQELLFRLGQRLRLPEWEPPAVVHERLWAIKYVLLIGLFGLSLQSLGNAERAAEVEPFKTVFALRLLRDWPFVVYALLLLGIGLFVRKAYCRYLCPLGAALTFPGRFRIFDWLRRRKECGRPCQICARECEVQAIRPTGEIIETECHYCLDCQITYWDAHKCPPLVEQRKKAELRARVSGKKPT
jgi:polyferredoxin